MAAPRQTRRPAECRGCGYWLDGHTLEGVCPECGLAVRDSIGVGPEFWRDGRLHRATVFTPVVISCVIIAAIGIVGSIHYFATGTVHVLNFAGVSLFAGPVALFALCVTFIAALLAGWGSQSHQRRRIVTLVVVSLVGHLIAWFVSAAAIMPAAFDF